MTDLSARVSVDAFDAAAGALTDGASSVSAHATVGTAAIADPIPSATANPPTRPTYFSNILRAPIILR
ncbi:hypothetical protein FK535_26200 [Mycolicibacterium sp. 018/SC-01/001]|uniref:hypothetical protein n=1 Tax=Mycolicibacterium sp. 018/SC-01/001 TaxID=2592069 RepID=UPI00117F0DAB|nr:hypothetical protein [Mycolicibacterium sp. 018/SC-01/001]TRW77885.1 hypothetical protein FK535_26200 [Mycolicibacterium sp. 018/SC-01/001]